jgi:hypothetical protein
MQAGIALKPATPAELVLPDVEAGLIDMVRGRRGMEGHDALSGAV